jgi:transposase-like protein
LLTALRAEFGTEHGTMLRVATANSEVLAFTAFPRAHWTKIWSTNPLERVNKEIKRRARVVGIFPNLPPSSAWSAPS